MNTFKVYFDGGCGATLYGSWEVQLNGLSKSVRREQYTNNERTCNVAEYQALISALRWLQSVKDKEDYSVEIWGDSRLVVRQLPARGWRCKKPHLRVLRDEARLLLSGFAGWSTNWYPRRNSVSRFGH